MFWLRLVLLTMLVLISTAKNCTADEVSGAQHGADLFYGRVAISGQLYLHNRPLTADFVRCVNCHQLQDQLAQNVGYGPSLGRQFLTQASARHGGPARAYAPTEFCAMLSRGIDPTGILIKTDMPRYRLHDGDCQALWDFLLLH